MPRLLASGVLVCSVKTVFMQKLTDDLIWFCLISIFLQIWFFFNTFFFRTYASPAPKANDGLAKAKFYTEMAKAKNAPALGVKVYAIVVLRPCRIPYPV